MPVRVAAFTTDALFNALLEESVQSVLVAVRLGFNVLASSELGGPIFPPEKEFRE